MTNKVKNRNPSCKAKSAKKKNPYKSKAQQRFLESIVSPLSTAQKKAFRKATDFLSLPERKGNPPSVKKGKWIPAHAVRFNRDGSTSIMY